MPRANPAEIRRRAIAIVEAGQSVAKTAADLGITDSALCHWVQQDEIFLELLRESLGHSDIPLARGLSAIGMSGKLGGTRWYWVDVIVRWRRYA